MVGKVNQTRVWMGSQKLRRMLALRLPCPALCLFLATTGLGARGFGAGQTVVAEQESTDTQQPGGTEARGPSEATEPPVFAFSGNAVLAPTAADVRVNPQDGQRYVWVPPGFYQQGCVDGDTKCKGDERPRRTVQISAGFWMRESEVTVGEYKAFAKAKKLPMPFPPPSGPALIPFFPPPSYNTGWKDEEQPMVMVPWEKAETYCREYVGGRLPTEAEWEYAARAGVAGKRYGDTDTITHASANYGAETCCKPFAEGEDKWQFAAPAKSFAPNPYGLFDLKGNVWEWTADWYGSTAYEGGEAVDPRGPASGDKRVIRGGGFDNTPDQLRTSERHTALPKVPSPYIGFRCIHLDLPKADPQGNGR